MINGVLEIVAAVLFAVVGLSSELKTIWLGIATVYLICGILNLVIYAVRNYRRRKAAEKAAAEKAGKEAAEKAGKEAAEKHAAAVPVVEQPKAEEETVNG